MPHAMFVHTLKFVKRLNWQAAACHVTYHVTRQPVPTKLLKQSYHLTKQFDRTKTVKTMTDGKTNG